MRMDTDVKSLPIPGIPNPIEDGWTLPAGWYSDDAVSALERERIFATAWQYAGRTDQVRGRELLRQPGRARADPRRPWPRRAAARLRERLPASWPPGRERRGLPRDPPVPVPRLDVRPRRLASSRAARRPGAGFRSLGPLAAPRVRGHLGPFVFTNPDSEASPLAATLGELPELVAESGVDLASLRFHSHHEWEIRSNWKVAIENFLECYHCPVAHPGFSKVIDVDPDAYELTVAAEYSSQVGRIRPSALAGNGKGGYVPRGHVTQAQYHFLWPNTTINIEAGPDNVAIERWVPTGLRTTVEVTDYFFGEDVSEEQAQEVIAFGTQVGEEDLALCESVQAGLDSRMVPQGRLMLRSEQLIHDFQKKVAAALGS